MKIKRGVGGKMNLDDSRYSLPAGDYPYAFNVFIGQRDGKAVLVESNAAVTATLPAGTNSVIAERETQKRKYYLVYNSLGFHSLWFFTLATRLSTKVFENKTNSGGVSILSLSGKKIPSINIVERNDVEGDIVSFTDGEYSPKEFLVNKLLANGYGIVTQNNIEAAKDTPPKEPGAEYGDDVTRVVNSLRKKLYQFRYRYVYDNNSKSIWSHYSKVALPGGIWSSPELELDPTKNNYIDVSVDSGGSSVTGIEISVRQAIGSGWGDIQLSHSVKKAEASIGDFQVYTYRFYGDGGYPFLSQRDQVHLFDYAPRKANAECLINGNVRSYGGILEGYNRISNSVLDVTSEVEMIENGAGATGSAPYLLWTPDTAPGERDGWLTLMGTPVVGTRYRVMSGVIGFPPTTLLDYTSVLGDTNASIAVILQAQQPSLIPFIFYLPGGEVRLDLYLLAGQRVFSTTTDVGPGSSALDGGYESTWAWDSRYNLPIVYFDEKERTNGAHLKPDAKGATVVTPSYELGTTSAKTPEVVLSINHAPPSWAVKYAVARSRNLTKESILFWKSTESILETGYYYFEIQSLIDKRAGQPSFVPDYTFADGDRIKVIIRNVGGTQTVVNEDYMVVGTVEREISPGVNKTYVKAKAPQITPVAYPGISLIELWRPASASSADELYYEFGETFPIITVGDVKYHGGSFQDQTGAQPAKVRLKYGDMYYRKRDDLWIMDKNYSDDYQSAVNSNGRPHVVDYDQKEEFFPARHRFSLEYQGDSVVNEMNRFYPDNRDDYDRSLGAICRLISRDQFITVAQEYGIGIVPIYQQVLSSAIGGDVFAQTDQLINRIRYISKDRGVGNQWAAFASGPNSDMFVDPTDAKICAIIGGRVIAVSEVNKYQQLSSWITARNNSNTEMHMCHYKKYNRFILFFNGVVGHPGSAFVFSANGELETELTLDGADMVGTMGDLLISYKNGVVWPHDQSTKNNFFGVANLPGISLLFNDASSQYKRFKNLSVLSSAPWFADEINTSTGQISQVPTSYLKKIRDLYHANFRRDSGSTKGILGGDRLIGGWIEVRFRPQDPSADSTFEYCEVECEPTKI